MTLEQRIRELAKNGELTHLSLIPRPCREGIKWSASYSPAKKWGHSYGEDADPVAALEKALNGRIKSEH